MKTSIKYMLSVAVATLSGLSAFAQAPNSIYFLDGVTQRQYLNPALMADCGWVETPFLNNHFVYSSDIGMGALMRPYNNDEMITFLHPSISTEDAMSHFKKMNAIELNVDMTLLNVGFKAFGGVNSVGISVHSRTGEYIPKEVFRFLKEGQENGVNEYNLAGLNSQLHNYASIAFGHSRKINDRLTVGAKAKLLLGMGYINSNVDNMRIYMGADKWTIEQSTSLVASKSVGLDINKNNEIVDYNISPSLDGFGAALDLGATYQVNDNLNVSLAITDIGFLKWSDASLYRNTNDTFEYTGFDNIADEDSKKFEDAADDIADRIEALSRYTEDESYSSASSSLHTTFRAGAEYQILDNKISFGLLGTARVGTPKTYAEGMLTVNLKPHKYFKMAINGSMSSINHSLGATITLGNFFVGADYILANYGKYMVPIDAAKFNISTGLSIKF